MSDSKFEIPIIVKRCLALGVKIYPHQLEDVLNAYQEKHIPDDVLKKMEGGDLREYISGLYLSQQESAGEWDLGYTKLETLGFKRSSRKDGHRVFESLEYITA